MSCFRLEDALTTATPTRLVARDVHRKDVVVGAVDVAPKIVLSPRRFGFEAFEEWAPAHLTPADVVVLEATATAWLLSDHLKPFVADVLVAHPQAVKLISAARVKTDSRETIKRASLLAATLIPAIWVPPHPVRELRALVAHRKRLVEQRTPAGNRLHGILHRRNLTLPPGRPCAAHQREWWLSLDLPASEKRRVQHDLSLYQSLEELAKGGEAELSRLSTCDPWGKQVLFLIQLPGLGVLSVRSVLAAIGEITRFPSAKHLVGSAGLSASVHASGETPRGGRSPRKAEAAGVA